MNEFEPHEKEVVYKAIYTRRDVRAQFKSDPIPDDVLLRILDAAHHAPSVGFSQPWDFIIIKDLETRRKVKDSFERERLKASLLIDNEEKRLRYLSFKLEGILESALNICITYDPIRFGPFIIGKNNSLDVGEYSVCLAIENLWLAARAEGIGLGWISILDYDELKYILNIPKHIKPIAYLALGYVRYFPSKPDLEDIWLPRVKLNDIIHYERW
jgi:5,6-dimethylbenzimidazole synthase